MKRLATNKVWRHLALMSVVVSMMGAAPPPPVISLTQVRSLSFGLCDNVPGAVYTVAAADIQGIGSCMNAYSAKFTVTSSPHTVVTITTTGTATITNGTDTLIVTETVSPNKANVNLGATGTATIWIGGSLTIPATGLVSVTALNGTDVITVQ